MKISLISKYRTCLMALSMIWIAIRHSWISFPWKPINFVLNTAGFGGVDAFLFLSGFGIYFACKKEKTYFEFMKKRLLRILPYSLLVMFLLFLFGKKTIFDALIQGSGLSLWFRIDWMQWYTSFIIFIYALTPLYYRIFKKKPIVVTTACVICVILLCQFLNARNTYIFSRIAIYALGFLFGYYFDTKPDLNIWWTQIFFVIGWVWEFYKMHYCNILIDGIPQIQYTRGFFLIIPGMLLLLAYIIDRIRFLVKPLSWLGSYSFQFYLVHEEILSWLYEYYGLLYRPGIHFDLLINIAAMLLSLLVAILIKHSADYILRIARIKI